MGWRTCWGYNVNQQAFLPRDVVFWEEIEPFKNVPGGKKMTAGLQLFDEAVRRMLV